MQRATEKMFTHFKSGKMYKYFNTKFISYLYTLLLQEVLKVVAIIPLYRLFLS